MTTPFVTAQLFAQVSGVRHGFFGRQGGESDTCFQQTSAWKYSQDN